MVGIAVKFGDFEKAETELLAVFVSEERLKELKKSGGFFSALNAALPKKGFEGKAGEAFLIPNSGVPKIKNVFLLGLGKRKELSLEKLRRASATVARACMGLGIETPSVAFPDENFGEGKGRELQAITEGAILGHYSFDKYITEDAKDKSSVKTLTIVMNSGDRGAAARAVRETSIVCKNVCLVRDMVNESPWQKNTDSFSRQVKALAKKARVSCRELSQKELAKQGLNLVLAVGRGAEFPPRMLILEYNGNKSKKDKIALVGKGVTFDTGGLDIKTRDMKDMKLDMGGAATMFGAVKSLAELKAKVNVVAVLPIVENAVGTKSYKPGSIIKSYSGKTVEVADTDAEGRLILADALAFTSKKIKPKLIVDAATLTGSCIGTFDEFVAGMVSNNDKFSEKMFNVGQELFERVWRMPLYDEFKDQTKSDVADVRNLGKSPYADMTVAAGFLEKFVGKTPWIHLDIAGTAFNEKAPKHYSPVGATGFGVRLLTQFVQENA